MSIPVSTKFLETDVLISGDITCNTLNYTTLNPVIPIINVPISSTDNAIVRFDGTGGSSIQNSTATIDDDGNLTLTGTLNVFSQTVFVKTKSDFPAPVGGVITLLAGYVYKIYGTINLGTDVIVCAASNTISGESASNAVLFTSNANPLLTTTWGVTLANITLVNLAGPAFDLSITSGGLGSKITSIVVAKFGISWYNIKYAIYRS